jgi:hypothetical protein
MGSRLEGDSVFGVIGKGELAIYVMYCVKKVTIRKIDRFKLANLGLALRLSIEMCSKEQKLLHDDRTVHSPVNPKQSGERP